MNSWFLTKKDSTFRLLLVLLFFFPKKSMTMITFFQAVDEPEFSQAYARMCEVLSGKKVTNDESSGQKPMNFQRMMITRCQKEFERDYMEG